MKLQKEKMFAPALKGLELMVGGVEIGKRGVERFSTKLGELIPLRIVKRQETRQEALGVRV